MSRSKKWRLKWAFFLGENGRRQYNKACQGCVHDCKQSFRAELVASFIPSGLKIVAIRVENSP
jgi:hypothetical protein